MRQASDIACLTLKAGSVSLIVRRGESISEAIFDSVNQSLIDGRVITGTAASWQYDVLLLLSELQSLLVQFALYVRLYARRSHEKK